MAISIELRRLLARREDIAKSIETLEHILKTLDPPDPEHPRRRNAPHNIGPARNGRPTSRRRNQGPRKGTA